MIETSALPGEARRLEALHRYAILDTLPEPDFDELARLAAYFCDTPVALISLVDADRQWFKARFGFSLSETPRHLSLCAHAIREPGLFVVPDALADPRFANNPLVTADPPIRFYAGAPLLTAEGEALGTLCVIDHSPRDLSPAGAEALRALSHQVVAQLEWRRARLDLERTIERSRATEESLRRSEQFKTRLIECSRDCIKVLDPDGHLLSMNAGGMEVLEICDLAPFLGSSWIDFWLDDDRVAARQAVEAARDGQIGRFVGSFTTLQTKRPMWFDVVVSPIAPAGERPDRLLALSRDVTQRKEAELALQRALTELEQLKNQLQAENVYLKEEVSGEHGFKEIVGSSPAIRRVLDLIEQVAATDATVLVTGETGTGKELVARAIHERSSRKQGALVKVNCAAIPAGLIESELFGHEKGAFTGAIGRKIGRFELADRGTIFLDEIGDLGADLQSKMLRVLQEGEIERVGGTRPIKINVRVIAATHVDLKKAMQEGRFRPDLFYRLAVFPIETPALRDRREDLPLLVQHFVLKHAAKLGKRIESIPQATLDALGSYPWPGNIRELGNVLERAAIVTQGTALELGDWVAESSHAPARTETAPQTMEESERALLLQTLEATNWKVSGPHGAAARLGLKPSTLESRLKRLGISRPQ